MITIEIWTFNGYGLTLPGDSLLWFDSRRQHYTEVIAHQFAGSQPTRAIRNPAN